MPRLVSLFALLVFAVPSLAQDVPAIRYEISWGAPNDHWLNVTMHVSGHEGETLDVRIPYWRPGRYVIQNYAKDIAGFSAAAADGRPLDSRKVDRNTWRVQTSGATDVVLSYRQYADQLDAGASYVGQGRLSLNPVTALMNVPGRETEPVSLHLALHEGWRVATALDYDPSIDGWRAADYHELVDSPFLASPDHVTHSFEAAGATFDVVVHGDWEYDPVRFVDHLRRIVEAQAAIMGDMPFDRYVFLYQFLPNPSGHGVEHRNSTSVVLGPAAMVAMPESLDDPGFYYYVLAVASHEFFHLWNVERIRPAALVPTDYSREQYTTQMWLFEGITDYYGDLALLRAGLVSEERFLATLAGTVRDFDNDPGRKVTSVAMSSFDSWAKQDDPPPFTFYSFYTAGKALGMVLDLEVRARTGGERSLDDVMRSLYDTYYLNGAGVPEDGFQKALETVTGTSFDAFFAAHIDSTADVDWDAALARAGLTLARTPDEGQPVRLGVSLDGLRITGVRPGSGAFAAGLDEEDVIVAVAGERIEDASGLQLDGLAPGDALQVTVSRWGVERTVHLVLDASDAVYAFEPVESPSASQQRIRRDWLASDGS